MDRRYRGPEGDRHAEAAVDVFRQRRPPALPVTDTAGVLIGIVTVDDVLDVAEEAATREIQMFGGSEALDEPYMQIALIRMVKKRAGWLVVLFLGEMLTATAMGFFEKEIARAVVLALFVPLIISSGGNSGSQASTLVIRALAIGELTLGDWWRVIRRELFVRTGRSAASSASIGFLRIAIWSAFSDIYGPHWLLVAFTVALCSGRHRAVGHAGRLDAAVRPAPARVRSRHLVGAVCRDAGRRHGSDHLLHGRIARAAWNAAVG